MSSRFWTSYTSIRGKSYGAAAPAGDRVHVRGHSAGASVTPRARGDQDEFDVAMTTGSSQQGLSVHLGTVQGTPDGPRWVPSDAPRPAGFRVDDAEALIVTAGALWEALGRQDPTGNLSELQVNLLAQAADRNDDAMCGGS